MGISVTGQNITNASTEGYSRKRIEQNAEFKRDGAFGQMGFGVEVYAINRVRDQFIDRLVNEEATRYGYFSMKDNAYSRIESIFNEGSDSKNSLNQLLNNFWNGWSDLANNPDKAGARETLRSATQSLVGQFHYLATQLRSYKDTINDEIEARVKKVNEITASIHRCNVVISGTEGALSHQANDTRDQRDRLLEELAQLVDVDYYEDDMGALIVSTNGNMLVSGAKNHELLMRRSTITEQDGYQYSRVEVSFAQTGNEFKPRNGELRALMDVRDNDIPKYEGYVNEVAKSLITEVNKIHQNGYTLTNATFVDFFDSDPNKLNAANISLSQAVINDINNIAAGDGGKKISSPNISSTVNQLFAPPGTNTQLLDLVNDVGIGDNDYRFIYKNSLVIKDADTDKILIEGRDYDVDWNTAQITFKYSAAENAFSQPVTNVSITFDYHESGFAGPGDFNNALLISQLRDKAVMQSDNFGAGTQTINQFYSGALGRLGVERNEAAAGLDTRTYAMQQLKTRQDEISGVNLNEEMASLIQYEHTYQASARYLTTINSMLETLLNM